MSFAADGDLVFRSLEETTNLLVRIKKDGTGRERITTVPVLDKYGVSPDGEWVSILSPATGQDALTAATLAVPIRGGAPMKICAPGCEAGWSSDGKFLYVWIRASAMSSGKTLAIPVPAGKSLPDLPTSGIDAAVGGVELPGALVIERGALSPGPDPSTYVFTKTDLQRNLFRIPLHSTRAPSSAHLSGGRLPTPTTLRAESGDRTVYRDLPHSRLESGHGLDRSF